ncbi:MAG TPA: hypothetical protein VK691_01030 [Solirubrobacteraceae bacterium]|nr:hypothetical protein [Solirubrobacteraceae bacterium]
MYREPLMLLREVREVAALASPENPEAVSQRAFDRARANSAAHAGLPEARQIARELKLKWPEVLSVAHAPEKKRSYLLVSKTRGKAPPKGWLTSARIRYALRLVAGRLGVDSLTRVAYDEERDKLQAADARDYLHGGRLRLPSANAISRAAQPSLAAGAGWRDALRIAGLKAHSRKKRTSHQKILSRGEAIDRFYDHYEEQPAIEALKDFVRGNGIPMSDEGGQKWSETFKLWRQSRIDRGFGEPRVIDYRSRRDANGRILKAPDFSKDVGAAKPGEYPNQGKWANKDLCVAWVAYYLANLPEGRKAIARDYDAWALKNPGAPLLSRFTRHGGWSAVQGKAEERIKTQGPPTVPPTPGPSPLGRLSVATSDDPLSRARDAKTEPKGS